MAGCIAQVSQRLTAPLSCDWTSHRSEWKPQLFWSLGANLCSQHLIRMQNSFFKLHLLRQVYLENALSNSYVTVHYRVVHRVLWVNGASWRNTHPAMFIMENRWIFFKSYKAISTQDCQNSGKMSSLSRKGWPCWYLGRWMLNGLMKGNNSFRKKDFVETLEGVATTSLEIVRLDCGY